MLQCTPTKCDISNPYCRTGKEGAYCDYEDPDKSRDPWTELVRDFQFFGRGLVRGSLHKTNYVCKTCENMNTPADCANVVDQSTSTCLKDCFNIESCDADFGNCICADGYEENIDHCNSIHLGCVEIGSLPPPAGVIKALIVVSF